MVQKWLTYHLVLHMDQCYTSAPPRCLQCIVYLHMPVEDWCTFLHASGFHLHKFYYTGSILQSYSSHRQLCDHNKESQAKDGSLQVSFNSQDLLVLLLTVCHIILVLLDRSIWYWINWLSPNRYFSLFSSLVSLILYWYCGEKFCLSHS